MPILEQGCRTCSCTRINAEVFRTQAVFLGTREECSAWIDCDVHTLEVLDGGWEIQRSSDESSCGAGRLDAFRGTVAHFEAGAVIRDLQGIPEPVRELLRECIRGIVQAETYLTEERGYASPEEQDDEFIRLYGTGCRFYAHPDDKSLPWSVYIGKYRRVEGLFHRYKSYTVDRQLDGLARISGTFCDSFHEIYLEVAVNPADGLIRSAIAQFLRAPGSPCFYCEKHAEALSGKQVTLSKRELGALLGGDEGCSHLVDLAGEMFAAAGRIVTES